MRERGCARIRHTRLGLEAVGPALTLPRPLNATLAFGLLRWAQRRPDIADPDEHVAFVGSGLRARLG
ncbi:hypothetical protein ACIRL2_41560 [Embleya sp. NPDC127516]|uniref:hypothetical protein n=1 Tax=Embleya sp. NPDC127516 TaxID=3363990 RepID=UPI003822E065